MPAAFVSIVILNYNYAHFVTRSIESALDQDYPHCEVVVVDDCSTDGSADAIKSFGDRVKAVMRPKNGGHGAAMNTGFAAATGDLVLFLDSDDYLYPSAVRRIVENRAPGVAQYQYRLDQVDGAGQILDLYPPPEFIWDDGDVTEALLTCGRYGTTVTSGLAFERAVLNAIMPMDEEAFQMGGDGFLVTVAPLYGTVKTIDVVLGAYCQHGGNHSQFATAVAKRARWRIHHDEMRCLSLREHAYRLGLTCAPDLWSRDPQHLEERIASLLLDPAEHPYPGEHRTKLARLGLRSSGALPVTRARRRAIKVWWGILGFGPLPLARMAVSWKVQAATRPALVKSLARRVRRATAGASSVRAADLRALPD